MGPASIALAATAAACNAFASVMQRKANQQANREDQQGRRFGAALLLRVVERPSWLLGISAMIGSFLLQATALSFGTLAAVEPVLVIELPLTLILSALLLHHPLPPRDWGTAAAMAVGLAVFIVSLAPKSGHAANARTSTVVIAAIATVVFIGALAALAHLGPDRSRAALFGLAAGSGFGLTASLMKIAVAQLGAGGVTALFTTWETYAMALAGMGSVILVQAALHSGTLVAAQPGITLGDPLISVVWGTAVVGESVRTGLALIPAVAGAAVIVVAVFLLSRLSPD